MNKQKAVFFLFIIAFAKTVVFSKLGFGLLDEGESLHNAVRILNGELPFTDFYTIFPPLDNYLFAAIFKIIGESIFLPRLITSIIYSFTPVLIFIITKRFTNSKYAFFISFLTVILNVNVDRLFFFTPILLGTLLFIKGIGRKKPFLLLISGVIFSVISLYRLDIPGAFLLGFVFSSIFYFKTKSRYWLQEWFLSTSIVLLGYIIPIFLTSVWMITSGIFIPFIKLALVDSLAITRLHSLDFPSYLDIVPKKLNVISLAESYRAMLGYFILSAYLVSFIYILKRKFGNNLWVVLGFLFSGLLSLPYIFGRSDIGHMVKGGLPSLILAVFIMRESNNNENYFIKYTFLFLLVTILIANIAQSFIWIRFNSTNISLKNEDIYLNKDYVEGSTIPSAQTLKNSVQFIHNNTSEEEPILILPYMAGLYYLSGRTSATEFNNVLAGFINTVEGERDFINKIESNNVNVVVYDPVNGPKMQNDRLKDYNSLIHEYVIENFDVVLETQEGWLFMLRK